MQLTVIMDNVDSLVHLKLVSSLFPYCYHLVILVSLVEWLGNVSQTPDLVVRLG